MVEKDGVRFERKVFVTGGSLATIMPPELISYLELKEGTEIELAGFKGKKGKFIALWQKKKGR